MFHKTFIVISIAVHVLTCPAIFAQAVDSDLPALVQQLSSKKFALRQNAMAELIQRGAEAIPELELALKSDNRELRFRAQRVLNSVEQNAYQLKLEAFMQNGNAAIKLPGWDAFRAIADSNSEARRLFVLMCRAEPDIMRNLDRPPSAISNQIAKRCRELQQIFRTYKRDSIKLGTVATLLFVGGIDGIRIDDTSIKTIYSVCNYNAFRDEMYTRQSNSTIRYTSTPRAEILRNLFAIWMKHGQSWDAQMAFNLAMQYNIRQCLPRALEIVHNNGAPCHVAQIALVAVVRFGEKEHILDLESRIEDKSFCGVAQRVGNKLHQTQLRDIALAGAFLLADKNPRIYGFDRISYTSSKQLNYSTVGFADEEARADARKQWDELRPTLNLPATKAPNDDAE
ncbi:MAG: hypothetical protein MKZ94_14815 [Pirellulales bacterium]|nr:hypothetical protein [Pirellulales bacterium]